MKKSSPQNHYVDFSSLNLSLAKVSGPFADAMRSVDSSRITVFNISSSGETVGETSDETKREALLEHFPFLGTGPHAIRGPSDAREVWKWLDMDNKSKTVSLMRLNATDKLRTLWNLPGFAGIVSTDVATEMVSKDRSVKMVRLSSQPFKFTFTRYDPEKHNVLHMRTDDTEVGRLYDYHFGFVHDILWD